MEGMLIPGIRKVRDSPLLPGCLLLLISCAVCAEGEQWRLELPSDLLENPAAQAALEDLRDAGERFGLAFETGDGEKAHRIQVGGPGESRFGRNLNPQGFRIESTRDRDGRRELRIRGGSAVGEVYGLYWLWDRIRVHQHLPEMNTTREPALEIRFTGGEDAKSIRNALRYTANWVNAGDNLKLFPWGVEPEDTENAKSREALRDSIRLAHSYGMKFLSGCDEFTYHPEYLAALNATLNPEDPNFWKALQEKYRRLFTALSELDGVVIRTGELTRIFGNYRAFDIIHEPKEIDWSLEKRYRTFVQKMHEVVVGEFDKIYFQRTWETSAREHHSDPKVFSKTFTEEVPTKNLYLSPYMSLADRWYYQPYNPTFNLTRHRMVVLLATLDYHAHRGIPVFPSFPGEYHQGGLRLVLGQSDSNLVGGQFLVPESDDWNVQNLTGYTLFRLAWNPQEDLRDIARDYASLTLGPKAAEEMVEAILLSQTAYKDGIYIKPVAELIQGNTLPHLRIGTFPVQGFPEIDQGREHIEWLWNTMARRCRGREEEAIEPLEKGLEAARRMEEITRTAAPRIDSGKRQAVIDSAVLARWLVETNVLYVKTCLAYFAYRDDPTDSTRASLDQTLAQLLDARDQFVNTPGFRFQLYGIHQLIHNAKRLLEDFEEATEDLASAPESAEVFDLIRRQQEVHREFLDAHPGGATLALQWKGRVDGKTIHRLRADRVEMDLLSGDPTDVALQEWKEPLPLRDGFLALRNLGSAPLGPFVLEQPSEENDFTAKIFLFDSEPGYGRWEFEVYWTARTPESAVLEIGW